MFHSTTYFVGREPYESQGQAKPCQTKAGSGPVGSQRREPGPAGQAAAILESPTEASPRKPAGVSRANCSQARKPRSQPGSLPFENPFQWKHLTSCSACHGRPVSDFLPHAVPFYDLLCGERPCKPRAKSRASLEAQLKKVTDQPWERPAEPTLQQSRKSNWRPGERPAWKHNRKRLPTSPGRDQPGQPCSRT